MTDFIEWLGSDAPGWVLFLAGLLAVALISTTTILTVWAIFSGYWIVPTVLLIVAPAYLVVREYLKSKGG